MLDFRPSHFREDFAVRILLGSRKIDCVFCVIFLCNVGQEKYCVVIAGTGCMTLFDFPQCSGLCATQLVADEESGAERKLHAAEAEVVDVDPALLEMTSAFFNSSLDLF